MASDYRPVGWHQGEKMFCLSHAPEIPVDAVVVLTAAGSSFGVLEGNDIRVVDVPEQVFLDQVTDKELCAQCSLPLNA